MFWFPTKKEIKKEFKKIANSFKKRDQDIEELKKDIVSKKEIDLMIREAVLKIRENSARTPQTSQRTPNSKIRKRANKILNKAEIMHEIGSMLQKGLPTEEIHHNIVDVQGLCKKTCFYKYLKIVRGKIREQAPQTPRTQTTN